MTEKLKTLLHESAETVDFAVPDVDALTRTGDRRVRRRRGLGALGGIAALALVGGVVVSQVSGDDNSASPDIANDLHGSIGTRADVTWATGQVIHVGDQTVDVGHTVNAFVRTSEGFVVADPDGTVWSLVSGDLTEIGHVNAQYPRLVSDEDGSRVGWVEVEAAAAPRPMVYDQSTGAWSSSGAATSGPGSPADTADEPDHLLFYAIDGDTAYWRDSRGTVAVDLASDEARVIGPSTMNGPEILDVENGVFAVYGAQGVEIGPSPTDTEALDGVVGSRGVLSPQATFYAPDEDTLTVRDVTTGQDVTPSLDGYGYFSTGYAWLDDETLAVIALKSEGSPISLLTCTVPSGDCTTVTDEAGNYGDFQPPTGEHLDTD